jgi:hypothetical protein
MPLLTTLEERPRLAAVRSGVVLEYFDGQADGTLFTRCKCADTDDIAGEFLAALVTNDDNHGVFPGLADGWVAKRALDAERHLALLGAVLHLA